MAELSGAAIRQAFDAGSAEPAAASREPTGADIRAMFPTGGTVKVELTPPPADPPLDEYGRTGDPRQYDDVKPSAAAQVGGRIAQGIVGGARQGFDTGMFPEQPGLHDAQLQILRDRGLLARPDAGIGILGTGVNRLAGAALGGVTGAVTAAGEELPPWMDGRQLARDVNALPGAFAGSPDHLQLLGEEPPPSIRFVQPPARTVAEGNILAAFPRPTDPPAPVNRLAMSLPPQEMPLPAMAGGEAVSQSVGAAASRDMSPPGVIDMTPAEMKANRRQAEKGDLLAPPEPGDTTIHVPGSLPTKAEYSGDPTVSQKEIMLRQRNPNAFEGEGGRLSDNTKARVNFYDNMTPSDTTLQRLDAERTAQAETDTAAILAKSKPANLEPALAVYDNVLNDARAQERDAVIKILGPLRDKLFDADGNLKTNPQSVWGIHDDLMNKLETAKDGTAAERFVKKELTLFKQSIDGVMNTATDNHFQTFLDNYAAKSQEINAGNLLREFRDKFTNGKGEIMANRFHNFVVDLAENRGKKGLDPAMDIPDEKMQALISLDKDLKRAGLIDLGKARGSPTDLFGTLAKGMGIVGAHAGMAVTSPGLGNVLLHSALSKGEAAMGNWRLKSQTKNHLAPPPGGYKNRLAPD
jgi:hypothetical protein